MISITIILKHSKISRAAKLLVHHFHFASTWELLNVAPERNSFDFINYFMYKKSDVATEWHFQRNVSTKSTTKLNITRGVGEDDYNVNRKWVAERCLGKNEVAAAAAALRPVVLSPDVQHEHRSDEEQRHDEDWNWTPAKGQKGKNSRITGRNGADINLHFDSGRVVGVEAPHSSGSWTGGPVSGGGGCCGLPLLEVASARAGPRHGQFAGRATSTSHWSRACRSRLRNFMEN